jgi:hypothetical protein
MHLQGDACVGQSAQNFLGLIAGKLLVCPYKTSEYILFYSNNKRGILKQLDPHVVNAWTIIGLVTKLLFQREIWV